MYLPAEQDLFKRISYKLHPMKSAFILLAKLYHVMTNSSPTKLENVFFWRGNVFLFEHIRAQQHWASNSKQERKNIG